MQPVAILLCAQVSYYLDGNHEKNTEFELYMHVTCDRSKEKRFSSFR